jgi:hypothetical protein
MSTILNSRIQEIAADMAEVFGEISTPIEWNGHTYQAVIADPSVQLDLQSGGFLPQSDFAVKVLRAALPTMPVIGQNVRIEGVIYQISGLTDKPTSPVVILHVQRS